MNRQAFNRHAAFTLIELLVVVGIIAALIAILLPSLAKARELAKRTACGANLHSIGLGMATYEAEMNTLPFSYIYKGQQVSGGSESPDAAVNGYVNWSALISQGGSSIDNSTSAAGNSTAVGKLPAKAFLCPSVDHGGLPPTNPPPGGLQGGQVAETPGVQDIQVPFLGYTCNEALIPRNKWVLGFQGSLRTYQCVKSSNVREPNGTIILATEWTPNWQVVTALSNAGDGMVVKSHRPVAGYLGVGSADLDLLAAGGSNFGGGVSSPKLQRANPSMLSTTEPNSQSGNRLDWIGHNHGGGAYTARTTNFLYLDGHVENHTVAETLNPGSFQWGQQVYSLNPGTDIIP